MKTGIFSAAYHDSGRLDKMKEHGYDCLDVSLDNTDTPLYHSSEEEFIEQIKKMKAEIDAAGLEVFQIHGPDTFPPRDATEESRAERFAYKVMAIKAAKVLGAKYVITHCVAPWNWNGNPDPDELWRINKDFFTRLAKVGEENDVVICLETLPWPDLNVTKPEDIKKLIEEIDSPYFQACLDTGHCTAIGISPADAARTLGKYVKTLHVHDNDGTGDRHWMPCIVRNGATDWKEFKKALKEIGYEGTMNLECSAKATQLPEHLVEYYEKGLAMIAKDLASGL